MGTPAWFDQHDALEQLNLQAHLNAQSHSDEFVKEALVTLDKVTVLVQELLVGEVGAAHASNLLEAGWLDACFRCPVCTFQQTPRAPPTAPRCNL